jgi:DNA-binding GntR family transcriptional regulator
MGAHEPAPLDGDRTARARANRLYARFRTDILTGRLPPGIALSETRVAAQHGISRTPVREVFQRLAKEGLLRVVPQIGTFVAPINLPAVIDSQFIREALECRAVRRAATQATPEQQRALLGHLARQAETIAAGDHVGFFTLDEAMHRELLRIAGHPMVWELIASVKAQLDRVRYLSLEDGNWLAMIFRQHQDIADRIAAGDAEGAEQAMQAHLRTVFGAIDRIAATHAAFFEDAVSFQPQQESA